MKIDIAFTSFGIAIAVFAWVYPHLGPKKKYTLTAIAFLFVAYGVYSMLVPGDPEVIQSQNAIVSGAGANGIQNAGTINNYVSPTTSTPPNFTAASVPAPPTITPPLEQPPALNGGIWLGPGSHNNKFIHPKFLNGAGAHDEGSYETYVEPTFEGQSAQPAMPQPTVILEFSNPKNPMATVTNISGDLAHNPYVAFAVWQLDKPQDQSFMPIANLDMRYLKAHTSTGPFPIFDRYASQFKLGQRIFGSVLTSCEDCSQGKKYWIYVEWGVGGWCSEIEGDISETLSVPPNQPNFDWTGFAEQTMAAIPNNRRTLLSSISSSSK